MEAPVKHLLLLLFSSWDMSDSFVTLWDYSPSGSSVHGISQARILEWWIAIRHLQMVLFNTILGRSSKGGHGNSLQYSCLEKPMDSGAWWSTVHGVAQNQTQLKGLSMQEPGPTKVVHFHPCLWWQPSWQTSPGLGTRRHQQRRRHGLNIKCHLTEF